MGGLTKPMVVAGDAFMKNWYTVFDYEKMCVACYAIPDPCSDSNVLGVLVLRNRSEEQHGMLYTDKQALQCTFYGLFYLVIDVVTPSFVG